MKTVWIQALAADTTVGSYHTLPPTETPWRVQGVSESEGTTYEVRIDLTPEQASKLVVDWLALGLDPRTTLQVAGVEVTQQGLDRLAP